MSAPPMSSKADSKRARTIDEPADAEAMLGEAEDRSVRQRIDAASSIAATESSAVIAPSVAASSSASSLSSSTARTHPLSLMRLAVVERQLVMQGLDITSLARLASSCRQMRGEALHKFIPRPASFSSIDVLCTVNVDSPAHASPLFRAHMPMTLSIGGDSDEAAVGALLAKASTFSRIATLRVGDATSGVWTEERMLQLPAQPWMQRLEHVSHYLPDADDLPPPILWLHSYRVQAATFALPCLTSAELGAVPGEPLYRRAVAQARALTSVQLTADSKGPGPICALRAAPSLTDLCLRSALLNQPDPMYKLIWCLPPTLRTLSLCLDDVPAEAVLPRPTLKTFFEQIPLLHTFKADGLPPSPMLRGMLDAGVQSLPMLRRVEFENLHPDWVSRDALRRFLHRFPKVHVRLSLWQPYGWQAEADLMQGAERFFCNFAAFPRVELSPQLARPPTPHPSDDESGSDVESLLDPGSDSEEPED